MLPLFLSVAAAYVIQRGICSVTFDTAKFDFRDLALAMPVIKYNASDGYSYFIKVCGSLATEDVGFNVEFGTSAVQCYNNSCNEIVFLTDFDYRPELPFNFTDGLIYAGDGNLLKERTGQGYHQYRILHNFHCDPSKTSTSPTSKITYEDILGMVTITIEYDTSYGCPTTVAEPTPTPTFNPDCQFLSRVEQANLSGISMDLSTINNGAYGLRHSVLFDTDPYVLYYTPCGRSICPIGATCTDATYSSAWLCTYTGSKIDTCTSYGLQQDKSSIVIDGSEYKGIYVTYNHPTEDRKLVVDYKCDTTIPAGYVIPSLIGTKKDGTLSITVTNKDVCVKDIPIPVPAEDACHYAYTQQNYNIDLNLKSYNIAPSGYNLDVSVKSPMIDWNKTLIYQPCGAVGCPDGYFCEGDEDADAWLCDRREVKPGKTFNCVGYGLFKYNQTASLVGGYIMSGLQVEYPGDLSRKAVAKWTCDRSLASGFAKIDPVVGVTGNTLTIVIHSRDACASGTGPTPSPPPVLRPLKPTMGTTPTPTPNPSPNPVLFYHNGTHFVYTNLKNLDQTPYEMDQLFVSRGKTGPAHSVFSPWSISQCPVGYSCLPFTESNLWTCWNDENGVDFCHPSGYRKYSVSMVPLQPDDLEVGYMISYEGGYGAGADIRVACSRGVNTNTLSNLDQYVTFHYGTQGFEFEYSTESELACPFPFEKPTIPNATPSPTPNPAKKIATSYTAKGSSGKTVSLDLTTIPNISDTVFIGYGKHIEKDVIFFSPIVQQSCPENYQCIGGGVANVWKCFSLEGINKCYSVGDSRYDLKFESIEDDAENGVAVNYEGGYGGYEVEVLFQCNRSVPTGQLDLDVTGVNTPQHVMVIYAHTQSVCSYGDESEDIGITGGAVFLSITMVVIVGYLVGGVIFNFTKKGTVALPNEGFWEEFGACIKAGAVFIGTCGKRTSTAGSYDAI